MLIRIHESLGQAMNSNFLPQVSVIKPFIVARDRPNRALFDEMQWFFDQLDAAGDQTISSPENSHWSNKFEYKLEKPTFALRR